MIFILNGPTGAGKSTISQLLMESLSPSFMLDGDSLNETNPWELGDPHMAREVNTLLAEAALFRLNSRYDYGILNFVFENQLDLLDLKDKLMPANVPVRVYRLTADDATFQARIRRRGREQVEWELARYKELQAIFALRGSGSELGEVVDTTGMDAEATRDELLRRAGLAENLA